MEDNTKSLVLGTLLGVTVGAVGASYASRWMGRRVSGATEARTGKQVSVGAQERVLQEEQFKRNIQFLGEPAFNKLAGSKVVIVGLGGTGSHAAHLLARSGVGFLRLIDFDQVSLSSLNRHAVATREDVGKSKVDVMAYHLQKTVPACECECVRDIFSKDNGRRLILSSSPMVEGSDEDFLPDFVIDCIDNVETKAFLLALCHQSAIPVITSCGAGCRLDPSRLTFCDINDAVGDPLLKATKLILNKKYKIRTGIAALYSSEKPPRKLLPFSEKDEDPSDYQTLPEIHMRVRIVPVLGPMPAIWGNALAMYVINTICEQKFEPQAIEARGRRFWDTMQNRIKNIEKKFCDTHENTENGVLNKDDTMFLIEQVWNFRSAYSGLVSPVKGGVVLVRKDLSKPISVTNAIPLGVPEVQQYYDGNLQFSPEQLQEIEDNSKYHI